MKTQVGGEVKYPSGGSVPTVFLSGLRATAAATSTSSAEKALPAGARVIAVRASVSAWIRWGDTGMGAAATDDNSQLFPAGEAVIPVPLNGSTPYTYFRVLREGSVDGYVQIEAVAHVQTST